METKQQAVQSPWEMRQTLRAYITSMRDVLASTRRTLKDADGNAIERPEAFRAHGICDQIHEHLAALLGVVAFSEYDEDRARLLAQAEDF